MCLDHGPFMLVCDDQETALENVTTILVQPDGLKLIDAFGKTRQMSGSINEIDLLNQRIVLA